MAIRPGGAISRRPLHFVWLCDCSGSMSVDNKMQSLNSAIRQCLPDMAKVAEQNAFAQVFLRSLKFSHGAEWCVEDPQPLERFKWKDLEADPLQSATSNATDIVFMVDTSGSMADEIDSVKKSCLSFAKTVQETGSQVRLGLVGFDIGGHHEYLTDFMDLLHGRTKKTGSSSVSRRYTVHNLSVYTIGIWPLSSPSEFSEDIQSLSLGLFGGGGSYLANKDTVDIFPHIVKMFDQSKENNKILVIISDEIGGNAGLEAIVSQLNQASITTHVLGVKGKAKAHEKIAELTGGEFWNINKSKGKQDFSGLLKQVAETIAREVSKKMSDGRLSSGTDMGSALELLAEALNTSVMPHRALPPVLVLISDGQPTDDYRAGIQKLMAQPWGMKSVRIGIAIGADADHRSLQEFIGNPEIKPLQANNAEELLQYIRWASTAVLQSVSSPASQSNQGSANINLLSSPPLTTEKRTQGIQKW